MTLKHVDLFLFLIIFHSISIQYIYLGVERYGEIQRSEVLNKDNQIYRFLIDNKEVKYKIYPGDIIGLKKYQIMIHTNAKMGHIQSKIN